MDVVVQYYIVNKDLEMTAGKVAAQVAHAAVQSIFVYHQRDDFKTWLESGQTKIILQATQTDLEKLADEGFVSIKDAGRTEVEPGSLTVVCLPPCNKKEAQLYTNKFKLYT